MYTKLNIMEENLEIREAKEDSSITQNRELSSKSGLFKKPLLIGKIGQLPRKITSTAKSDKIEVNEAENCTLEKEENELEVDPSSQQAKEDLKEPSVEHPLPYKEPVWSGLPQTLGTGYSFEVLKSGVIVDTIDLMEKTFWVFGRLPNCDIYMAHPTISRFHAVLQYRIKSDEDNSAGFYIYDLSSTHGTFLNKNRLRPRVYARVKVGHMIKLGCSTRNYILTGPEEDTEEESTLTVTELKQKRIEELAKREEEEKQAAVKAELEEEAKRKKEEERGIDWGMGDDAEEEADLSENPYAQTNNEELYINDPKKALRGFMEREGFELEYDCEEQGFGQFLCRVELPLDDEKGRPIVAEVLHKGKKKEAVVQCALEACRILDRYGVLRQATHESRKRKAKNWEDDDYYDSDEDTFLDRTGTIEKKREKRMQAKVPQKPETYESLVEKEKNLSTQIADIEKQLQEAQLTQESYNSSAAEEDSLDSFMKGLKQVRLDKQTISKLKSELVKLKQEHTRVVKLANIAKPANLPPLVPHDDKQNKQKGESSSSKALPIFGKRRKIKVQLPQRKDIPKLDSKDGGDEEEEDESEDEENNSKTETVNEERKQIDIKDNNSEGSSNSKEKTDDDRSIKTMTIPFEESNFAIRHISKIIKIMNKLKKLAMKEDRMQIYSKTLEAKKRKILQQIRQVSRSELTARQEHQISTELERIYKEVVAMTMYKVTVIDQVKDLGKQIKVLNDEVIQELERVKNELAKEEHLSDENLNALLTNVGSSSEEDGRNSEEDSTKEFPNLGTSKSVEADFSNTGKERVKCDTSRIETTSAKQMLVENEQNSSDEESEHEEMVLGEEVSKKKRKRNQKRVQQKQHKVEVEKQKGYEEDAQKDGYNMWVPPEDQTGDGRTSLNDKLGY